jgi:drug/metabolite transporter (DMT)-like permease
MPSGMSAEVLLVVLFAALLHATWNAILKASKDTGFSATLVALTAAAISAAGLPFLPAPAPESWPFIAASTVLQFAYYALLAATYRVGDMSSTYPLMRGAAPMLVALASGPLVGEALSTGEWTGLGLICAGVLGLSFVSRHGAGLRATVMALANAVVIASYTLVDGLGVRLSGSPVAYTLWISLLPAVPMVTWTLVRRGRAFVVYARRHYGLGAVGGMATLSSYGLALWAMTHAPVALVAGLRETSIVFATVISALVLKEPVTRPKLAVTAAIAAGAAVLRMA